MTQLDNDGKIGPLGGTSACCKHLYSLPGNTEQELFPLLSWLLPGEIECHAVLLQRAVLQAAEVCDGPLDHCQKLLHILALVGSARVVAKAGHFVAHL